MSAKSIGVAILSFIIQIAGLVYAKGKNINIVSSDFALIVQSILAKIPVIGPLISGISLEIMVSILSFLIILIFVSFIVYAVKGSVGIFIAFLVGLIIALILLGGIKLPTILKSPTS